jgi:uncharacterized protein YjbI with pentapeptide repeats
MTWVEHRPSRIAKVPIWMAEPLEAKLQQTNLRGTKLDCSNLRRSNLNGADLEQVDHCCFAWNTLIDRQPI